MIQYIDIFLLLTLFVFFFSVLPKFSLCAFHLPRFILFFPSFFFFLILLVFSISNFFFQIRYCPMISSPRGERDYFPINVYPWIKVSIIKPLLPLQGPVSHGQRAELDTWGRDVQHGGVLQVSLYYVVACLVSIL